MGDPDEQGITRFPGLPAGAEFGEQISTEHLASFEMITRSAQLVSEKGSARLLQDIKNRGSASSPLDSRKDQLSIAKSIVDLITPDLAVGYTEAYEEDTEKGGMRDAPGWGSPNEKLRSTAANQIANIGGDITTVQDQVMGYTQRNVDAYEGRYDPSGRGDYSYTTYVPSANSQWLDRNEYILELEAHVKRLVDAGDDRAQKHADDFLTDNLPSLYINMVTQ